MPNTKFASETSIGRKTLYALISEDSEFNTTLARLGLLLRLIEA